ncbi:hypothetical protein C8R43DRAFT_1016863 [Mycena crocata]|nr:hypothetical protein C8R43DRAFT_1016863 [Mycena crocata]
MDHRKMLFSFFFFSLLLWSESCFSDTPNCKHPARTQEQNHLIAARERNGPHLHSIEKFAEISGRIPVQLGLRSTFCLLAPEVRLLNYDLSRYFQYFISFIRTALKSLLHSSLLW